MMGQRQQIETKLFYSNLSLDSRVRPDNPLRQVKAMIDFDFVRAVVRPLYGRRGNPSVDPALLMKLMLLLILENVSSERELMDRMYERLDWMWFCGYDWDDTIHNHSVISKARRRWGVDIFAELFQRVLHQCIEAGLVDGRIVHVDGSIIRANASKDTIHPAFRVAAGALYERLEQQADHEPEPAEAAADDQLETSAAEVEPSAGEGDDDDRPPAGTLLSPTDPDARLTRKYGQTVLGYKDHRMVDDQSGVITSTVTTDAGTAESHMLEEVLDQHELNVGSTPHTVVADKGYGTADVYESMAKREITPCIPHQNHKGGKGVGIYEARHFKYDQASDAYLCPNGQWLRRFSTTKDGGGRYRAVKGVCAACPMRSLCTNAKDGRRLTRHAGQEWIDWADGCYSREHRRRLCKRRMYRAEGSFADAANNHGYKRARWRGLAGMTIQNLLVATTQNLRKLMRARRRKPGMAASVAITSGFSHVRDHLYRLLSSIFGRRAIPAACPAW